ncbi:hypothetical protein ACFLRB_02460 [Acidobacteriota bacterium]
MKQIFTSSKWAVNPQTIKPLILIKRGGIKILMCILVLLLCSIGSVVQLYAFETGGDNKSDMAVWRPIDGIWYVCSPCGYVTC